MHGISIKIQVSLPWANIRPPRNNPEIMEGGLVKLTPALLMAPLENKLQAELQAAPSNPVGDDIAGKSITAVSIELSTT